MSLEDDAIVSRKIPAKIVFFATHSGADSPTDGGSALVDNYVDNFSRNFVRRVDKLV